jgi:acetyl esterase/lipase
MVAESDAMSGGIVGMVRSAMVGDTAAEPALDDLEVDGVAVYVATPPDVTADDRRIVLDIHGGAFVFGGGAQCRAMAPLMAAIYRARTWSVDYRMPPDHPFPAALDDCLAVYRAILADHRPGDVVVAGGSAGGNLAAALLLRVRDEGLPLPAGLVLQTPAVDLTCAGDTFATNLGIDNVLTGSFTEPMELYAAGHDLRHPHLSPLFGDLTGLPPSILTSGTRDLLLSDTVRMHRALRTAGVAAELHVWEAASHGGFLNVAPEDKDRAAEIRRFIGACWAGTMLGGAS